VTLDQLLEKVPPELRPVAAKYGPALVAMTAEQFAAWLDLLIRGKTYAAWQEVMARLDDAGLLAEWQDVGTAWDTANAANAERLAFQRQAALAVLKVLLAGALAMVGL
jgi:hypothetical protein